MANFLEYIEEDIKSKKTLFSTMPTKTKTNIRRYNEKLTEINKIYKTYQNSVKKYLDLKSRAYNIPDNRNTTILAETIADLENMKFILNPTNTYFEKLGLDTLFYQLANYSDFNFNSLNEIINSIITKFEMADIKLTENDFSYTFYVKKFMAKFLEIRNSGSENYDKLTEIFEKIYWENPGIISHIELNFRKLVKTYEKKLSDYITKISTEISSKNKINYNTCLEKLKDVYKQYNYISKENISDIIIMAKNGEIDSNAFFNDSKIRTTAFSSLMIDPINLDDTSVSNKFYSSLSKLKANTEEYANYIKFSLLIMDFKSRYLKNLKESENTKVEIAKKLKEFETQIANNEAKLTKLNKKIFGPKLKFFEIKEEELKDIKLQSIKVADELKELYKRYTEEYFRVKALSLASTTFTVTDLLHLYYSFDYYKKEAIKRVYEIDNYKDLIEYSDSFDLFAMNPTNVIICTAASYNDEAIAKVIVNKYRLLNINITEEDLSPANLDIFLDKLNLVLRVREIEKSTIDVEKLWFMAEIEKLSKNL